MAIRKVARMGHPVLRKKAEAVAEKDVSQPAVQNLIRDMIETMSEYNGRGLAGPQIHESLQIIVMLWDFEKKKDPFIQILINPKIKLLTQEQSSYWEGCLSLPGLIGKVSRVNRVMVEALNEKGKKINFIAEGFAATVVQHEADHLEGVLYLDHVKDTKDFVFSDEYQRYLMRDSDEPEEEM